MLLISSENYKSGEDILEGIAYHNSGLICFTKGLEEFKTMGGQCDELIRGRFFLKYNQGNDTILRVDENGNELIFYFVKDDFWCVSTSFLGLLWYVSDKGYKLTASKLELAKMFIKTSLFEQPYSDELPVKNVKLLDSNYCIRISDNGFEIEKTPSKKLDSEDFFSRVNFFFDDADSTISGLIENFDVTLELSGGIDSRVVLGLALPFKDRVSVSSDKRRRNDYILAKELSKIFDIKFNQSQTENFGKDNLSHKWVLYKLGNVGVSRTNSGPNAASGTKYSTSVRLNGGGGGGIKPFYNSNCNAYLRLIDKSCLSLDFKELVKKDLLEALDRFGYCDLPNRAMVSIYEKYRARLFAGRAWYGSLLGLVYAPMASKLFKELLASYDIEDVFGVSREEIVRRNLIFLFILHSIDPLLTVIRFDEQKKDFSFDDIDLVRKVSLKRGNNARSKNQKLYYGKIKSDSVVPDWVSSRIAGESIKSNYEDFLYRDISKSISHISSLGILSKDGIEDLENRFSKRDLGKVESLACLHISEIIKSVSTVED